MPTASQLRAMQVRRSKELLEKVNDDCDLKLSLSISGGCGGRGFYEHIIGSNLTDLIPSKLERLGPIELKSIKDRIADEKRIGQESIEKSQFFFKELNIKNLDIYIDAPITLARKFTLRGVPTTILFNKNGKEFARIIGSIDFNNEDFINWLKTYN